PIGLVTPTAPQPLPSWPVSAAVAGLLLGGLGGRDRLVDQPGLELLLYLLEIVRLGLEVAGMRPLEGRLQRTADPPIGVAQVIVDRRILRLELDGALELLDRLVVIGEPVERPAERIDDVAVIGALIDRLADHPHAVVDVDALVDPRIAEIVEDLRLI